jgi:hypothetical protein
LQYCRAERAVNYPDAQAFGRVVGWHEFGCEPFFRARCAARRATKMEASVSAEIVTVYWALDGGIHHVKCGQRMVANAWSAEELHVSCPTCAESLRLPLSVLSRIPVAT